MQRLMVCVGTVIAPMRGVNLACSLECSARSAAPPKSEIVVTHTLEALLQAKSANEEFFCSPWSRALPKADL